MGRTIKEGISRLMRKTSKPWYSLVADAVHEHNAGYVLPSVGVTPLEFYEDYEGNLEKFWAKQPQGFAAQFKFPLRLTNEQASRVYRFRKRQQVMVDLTPVKRELRSPFTKISEGRHRTWARGEICSRRLADASEPGRMVARYLVKVPGRRAFWAYESGLKPAADDK